MIKLLPSLINNLWHNRDTMRRWHLALLILTTITIIFWPALRAGTAGARLYFQHKSLITSAQNYAQRFFTSDQSSATTLTNELNHFNQRLNNFNHQAQRSWILNKLIPTQLNQLTILSRITSAMRIILTGQQNYVLLFQNSEELRATGGFLGSYAKLELSDGQLQNFKIEDIYVPDGQFDWFIEAPAGAKEYLSGGEGLKLRDANWSPDFPTSAQQILTYLAWGKELGLDGAIAINLQVVEDVLNITGPIYLHDYDQTVTANNFANVARADRSEFFPGSVQKQHFLNTFFNQLIITLNELNKDQQWKLLQIFLDQILEKNIQFFSHQDQLQAIFNDLKITGELSSNGADAYLMLVESNVGINKANQHLDRAVNITSNDFESAIEVTFVNHNFPPSQTKIATDTAGHLGYVNYQRLIIPPQAEVKEIVFNQTPITNWDEEIISNQSQENFKQIGFLITVPEKETRQLKIVLDNFLTSETKDLMLQKQSGIKQIPYHLTWNDQELSIDLTKDTLVKLKR